MTTTISQPVSPAPPSGTADADLLDAFVCDRNEPAFHDIVQRHGPLVMGVCIRVLSHREDAEDAFQATFIVLARRAAKIRKRESLASWLYGVAYRISLDLARSRQRKERMLTDEPITHDDPFLKLEHEFDKQAVDEELQRLPRDLRTAMVLFYLSGQTSKQIAEELGTTQGTIDGRLKRGRQQLRVGLTRRGVAMSGMLSLVCVSAEHATAAVSPTLVNQTVTAGLAGSASAPIPTEVSSEAIRLAGKEIMRMSLTKTLASVLCIGLLATVGAVCVNAFDGQAGGSKQSALDTRVGAVAVANPFNATEIVQQKPKEETATPPTTGKPRPDGSKIEVNSAGQPALEEVRKKLASANKEIRQLRSRIDTLQDSRSRRRSGTATQSLMAAAKDTQAQDKIAAALSGKTEPIQGGETLKALLDFISEINGFAIVPDRIALEQNQIESLEDLIVSEDLSLSGIKLSSAMDIILEQLDGVDEPLDYIVEHEVMKITTRDAARVHLEERVYRLALTSADPAPDELLEVLNDLLIVPGTPEVSMHMLGTKLILRHNQRSHRKLIGLLAKLGIALATDTKPATPAEK